MGLHQDLLWDRLRSPRALRGTVSVWSDGQVQLRLQSDKGPLLPGTGFSMDRAGDLKGGSLGLVTAGQALCKLCRSLRYQRAPSVLHQCWEAVGPGQESIDSIRHARGPDFPARHMQQAVLGVPGDDLAC